MLTKTGTSIKLKDQQKNILIIENNTTVCDLYKSLLSRFQYNLYIIQDGESALRIFRQNYYDLIITDIKLPQMSGWAVIEEIRKIDSNIPVIIISSLIEDISLSDLSEEGNTLAMNKPFKIKDLNESVAKFLDVNKCA